jgi:CRISPR-associated endonuclease/helicase Cas3
MLYAHTPDENGVWHPLGDHLNAVADLASAFASAFDGAAHARWAGGWHDVGKASAAFQGYLTACAREPGRRFKTVDHKGAGVLAALGVCEPLAFLVQGHHGGLPDRGVLSTRLKELRDARGGEAAREAMARAVSEGVIPAAVAATGSLAVPAYVRDPLSLELFLRMLFSALVDADWLDTEAHWEPEAAAQRGTTAELGALTERLEAAQAALMRGADGAVNDVRREVHEACLRAAELAPGFFRLTVPTGGGKTRSAMAFALRHALRHGLRRVIVVCPYLTITDQTADVLRGIFGGDRVVLEHHSDAGRHDDPAGPATPEAIWRRLATQNWDASVIVTTAVQFFESLFGNGTTICRKLHRIAKSVVILDEVQTLPPGLLTPILDVLRALAEHYGVTVVLSTATQPALADAPGFRGLPDVREIAPEPSRLFATLRRVRYEWPAVTEAWTWNEVADWMRAEAQALAILNTKRDALALLDALGDPDALHLSTLLCAAHRREVLAQVRARLSLGAPCRLVTTQVVEAGVDLDFPIVLRAIGPLDRIVQAAGRCNREGRLKAGRVVVFRPADGGMPAGAYRTAAEVTWTLLQAGTVDPDDPAIFESYFRRLFGIVERDKGRIQELRAGLNYEQVATAFRLIDEETVSVLVRYRGMVHQEGEPLVDHRRIVEDLIRELRAGATRPGGGGLRRLMARAQPYLVAMRRREVDRLASEGLLSLLVGDVWLWEGRYDGVRGIGGADAPGLDATELVV